MTGAERTPLEVHVEASHDDPHATEGQFVAYLYQAVVEELCLIDAHYVDV